jgi:uncharacterized membrane protein YphA (DoxX/SURF4 family)
MLNIISLLLRLLIAIILLQTLYFKFTAQPESVELFTKLGAEPYGRIGTGIAELIASILILMPSTIIYGAIMGVGLMAGAILSHLLVIGIESQGDGGQLFMLACIVFVASLIVILLHRSQLFALIKKMINTEN